MKTCPYCKREEPSCGWAINKHSKSGFRSYCRDCCKKKAREYYYKHYEYTRKMIVERDKKVGNRFTRYKKTAKNRGVNFLLSLEEFDSLTSKLCVYCNRIDPRGSNGLDRIDSSRGYEKGNIVPCCEMCNVAKNRYSLQQFLENISRISARLMSGDLQT